MIKVFWIILIALVFRYQETFGDSEFFQDYGERVPSHPARDNWDSGVDSEWIRVALRGLRKPCSGCVGQFQGAVLAA
jgi:hypothetical protein